MTFLPMFISHRFSIVMDFLPLISSMLEGCVFNTVIGKGIYNGIPK